MQLKRYACKERGKGVMFVESGEIQRVNTYDFDWFLTEGTIGITPQSSTEAECFYNGFLGASNTGLTVAREPKLLIERRDDPFGKIVQGSGRAGDGAEISKLIELLTTGEGAHAFLTAEDARSSAYILTFSRKAPSADVYRVLPSIPIEIRS